MTDTWPNFTHEAALKAGFLIPCDAEAEELHFLSYEAITQEQVTNVDDSQSFIDVNTSISSDSSEEEDKSRIAFGFQSACSRSP